MKILELLSSYIQIPCPFHQITGYYCPGCGGTRAFHALMQGQIFESLRLHPIVLYIAVLGVYSILHLLLDALHITKRRYHFHVAYAYVALGIIILRTILLNICLFWGWDLLSLSFTAHI